MFKGSIVALLTPFKNNTLDEEKYAELIHYHIKNGTNGLDIFVHDRQTGVTEQVSLASDGTQGNGGGYSPSISSDGRFITFNSTSSNLVDNDTNSSHDIFVHDRQTGTTERIGKHTLNGFVSLVNVRVGHLLCLGS